MNAVPSNEEVDRWILDSLSGQQLSGFEIAQHILLLDRAEGTSFEKVLYPALHRLEAEGWVHVTITGEPPRRTYSLVRKGRGAHAKALKKLVSKVQNNG